MVDPVDELGLPINDCDITLHPEMNKPIVELLRIRNTDIVSMYAAKLIEHYQQKEIPLCGVSKYDKRRI